MPRRRLDTVLAERGLARSRATAAASVRAGRVRLGADGPLAAKPSQLVPEDADLVVAKETSYVSRGGIKLENALESLELDVAGLRCLDVGASTGGFTDCLLRHGAAEVAAVDVGYGQLDWGLRNDSRVTVLERVNARALDPADLPFPADLATADVSFISLAKILPTVSRCLAEQGGILALVKPQFELGRGAVGRGGVVRSPEDRRRALLAVAGAAVDCGLVVRGFAASGLPGPKGNRESFIWAARQGPRVRDLAAAVREVEP